MLTIPTFTLAKGSTIPDPPLPFPCHLSAAALADLLRDAAAAHHAFEQLTGTPDPLWADWYAVYMSTHVHSFLPGGSHDR